MYSRNTELEIIYVMSQNGTHLWTMTHMCVCGWVGALSCICACVCVCVCALMHMCVCVCARALSHAHMCVCVCFFMHSLHHMAPGVFIV